MSIDLSPDVRKQAQASLRRYFTEELDQEIGDLKAQALLDFFLKEIAPSVYNHAIGEAQAFLRDRVADLEGTCFEAEFAYWPKSASVRRRL